MTGSLLQLPARLAAPAADLLFPPTCQVCEERLHPFEQFICEPCRMSLLARDVWRCTHCGATDEYDPPPPNEPCRYCPPEDAHWRGALSAAHYRVPEVRRVVQLFKYHRRLEIGETMARLMIARLAEPLRALEGRIGCVVPVPLHWSRRMSRGFNQSRLLAERLADALDLPLHPGALRRIRRTKMQTRVPKHMRAANVRDAFIVPAASVGRLPGVLLVDDVVTSGHTVGECARVLHLAGAPQIWVASFARGSGEPAPPPTPEPDPTD